MHELRSYGFFVNHESVFLPALSAERLAPANASARPEHVLFLFDQLRSLNGGAERSLLRLTQMVPPDRYRSSVATFWQPENPAFLRDFPCPVHVLPFTKTFSFESVKVAKRLHDIIRRENVSIVQTFFPTSDLWGGAIAKLSGCPVLISSRRDMGYGRKPKHSIAYRTLRPMFDQIHAVSDAVRQYTIREDRIEPSRVVTIPNGVEIYPKSTKEERRALRERFGLDGADTLILGVGTIRRVRGYEVLIRAAKRVCQRYPGVMFAILGLVTDEQYFHQLKTMVRELDLNNNFRFLGYCENVAPLLGMGDLYCHLSLSDGLSNALLEAMAAGLPSVITNVGGNPEVVEHGRTGFIGEPGDDAAAAEKLCMLLTHPVTAEQMGEAARSEIKNNFSAEAMGRRFASLYDELLFMKRSKQIHRAAAANTVHN